ncbi:MAG: hypothetical protein II824_03715 [Bacteroidales bacterium]|nr:hypothetical protein [Bacteroidales bacterium]
MKKAFIRILCLLLGVNVFTACYGPGPRIPYDEEVIQQELEALEQEQKLQEELPESETETETETPGQE